MTVVAPNFIGQAVWSRRVANWTCLSARPVLRWMIGKAYHEVFPYLERKGWKIGWGDARAAQPVVLRIGQRGGFVLRRAQEVNAQFLGRAGSKGAAMRMLVLRAHDHAPAVGKSALPIDMHACRPALLHIERVDDRDDFFRLFAQRTGLGQAAAKTKKSEKRDHPR